MEHAPDSDVRSDEDLVAACNEGDYSAFEVIYHRYRDWVTRLARRFSGNDDDALDVLQDTFLYLSSKFPGFRLTARMTTFLYPTVKHLALAARRKAGRFVSGDEALRDVAAPPAGESGLAHADLAAVVGSLPEGQREPLIMRFVDGMSLGEIADALQLPLGTVKSRLHRAVEALREDGRTRRYFEPD